MIGYSKKNRENCPKNVFDEKKKRPGLKFNSGLALIGFRTELISVSLRYFVLVDFMVHHHLVYMCCDNKM